MLLIWLHSTSVTNTYHGHICQYVSSTIGLNSNDYVVEQQSGTTDQWSWTDFLSEHRRRVLL